MDTCIGLRTAVVKDGTMYVQAGGGVVADSTPEGEWAETRAESPAPCSAPPRKPSASPPRPKSHDPPDRQLRQLHLQPRPLPRRPRRRAARSSATTPDRRRGARPRARGHRHLARPLHADRGRHLPRPDRRRRRPRPDPGRLPRPPGDRPGLRRRGRPRADADARQGRPDPPRGTDVFAGLPSPFERDPVPQPDRRARDAAGRPRRHRLDRATASSWACATARCRSSACSSTRRASPPSTATPCSATSSRIARGSNAATPHAA